MKFNKYTMMIVLSLGLAAGCAPGDSGDGSSTENLSSQTNSAIEDGASEDIADHIHNDSSETQLDSEIESLGCVRASSSQKAAVNLGNTKRDEFLQRCAQETNNSFYCAQLVRPNPRSSSTFRCTYGSSQNHTLVHPDENTWKYPIEAVKVLQDLSAKGIKISHIYNWWRPEPYNKNVGGAKGRHPYGTSVDVRFGSESEANKAFRELCKMRAKKRIRAIGHYGSASLHIGVGDRLANTWGKSCN